MKLGKSDCIIEHNLRYYISPHKIDIGLLGSLLSNNFPTLTKCTPNLWITNTRKFLYDKNMKIEENTPNLRPQCLKESHIMEYFIRRGIQGKELAELKRCQIYLKSKFLSDLAT